MPSALGQIGQNVADSMFELAQSAVKGTAGAMADIVSESIDQVTSAPSQVGSQSANIPRSGEGINVDKEKIRAEKKRRYEAVKSEMELYIQRRKQLDQKIEEENAMKKNEKDKKIFDKQKKESFTQNLLKKLGAGSHGETAKQKE